jgi:hypothetical protein
MERPTPLKTEYGTTVAVGDKDDVSTTYVLYSRMSWK